MRVGREGILLEAVHFILDISCRSSAFAGVPRAREQRVLSFGLLQDGNVGVGVFPEGEEWNPNSPHRLSWGLATRGSSFPSAIHQILSVQH
jgi:hypothetical protein